MTANKSIDGLSTRDAKNEASKVSSDAPAKKVTKSSPAKIIKSAPKTEKSQKVTKTIKPEVSEIIEDTLEITVEPDFKDTPKTREKSVKNFLEPVEAFDFDSVSGELTETKSEDKSVMPKTTKDEEPKSSKKSEKLKKTKKKASKARKIIVSVLLAIVLILIGLVLWVIFWGNDIIAKITGGQSNVLDLLTFVEETYDPLKTDEYGRTNILAFGTSGYNMEGDEGDGTHDGAQLTDSIMLISLNQETGDIAMLSLPRDLKASPTCTATGKINEVYWCNNMYDEDEAAGATALIEEVSYILGVDIQYYAHLNWGSLVSIVDLLDGINVTLDEDIDDDWWTGAVFEAGVTYHLNGEEALGLARARHGTAAGDFTRGASQQKILIGIKDKVFEKDLTIADLLGLASTLGDNLRTNFTLPELKTLAHLTYEFNFDSMRQISLLDYNNDIYLMTMGTLDNGISYVFPAAGVSNYYDIREYVLDQLLWTPPEPEEDPEEQSETEEVYSE